ncbi:hypothetical protein BD413DRAFT_471098 [Trametes elegans]|nr:hypothetical protein BD413DRAFT_471098 [Trametes elegans]
MFADTSSTRSPVDIDSSRLIDVDPSAESSPLPATHSRSSTQFDSAYSQTQTDISFDSVSSEANQSMTTTTRAFKRIQLPVNRPSTLLERQSSSRNFSLPEATPKFRMKNILGKKTARVVSGPASTRKVDVDLDISTNVGDPFVSEDEERTRVRVKSQATDVPYTPSVPSSPDSVVIIANNSNQLSNDFLRPRPYDVSPPESDDQDWITWTDSPPRPIPALHGPLSLPYARCPSGAEGTIIEEPDSLPRVIWGLDADESKNSRVPVAPSSQAVSKKATPVAEPSMRPKPKVDIKQTTIHVPLATRSQVAGRILQVNQGAAHRLPPQARPQPPDFILKHSEPIDLGRLVSSPPDLSNQLGLVDQNSRWQTSFQHQLPTPDLVPDLSPELQAMLFAQERLRTQGPQPSSLGVSGDLHGLLRSSAPASSPLSLLESIQSSRSPIVLDNLTSPYGLYAQGFPSQMVALDAAQKLRHQQLQSGVLPTPPTSTSPLWSSRFSPYQGGVLSPELLAAAGLSQLSPHYLTSQTWPTSLDSSQKALRSVSGSIGNGTYAIRRTNMHDLDPPAQIENVAAHKLPPRLAAEYARRRAVPERSIDSQQLDTDFGHRLSSPVRGVAQSPMAPRPPPNTPYSASPYSIKRLDPRIQAAPSSPTSPHDSHSLGLSQHARSIPLTKLVQRRLSIVPEEDYASSAESSRTPGTKMRAAGGASGLHKFLSQTRRANASAASLDLLGDTLGPLHGMDDAGAAPERSSSIAAGGKPLGVPGRACGPGAREAQAVKEVHRRQGSSNANKDGGQRGEGSRGRGQKRGGRGRRGRGGLNAMHGAERVDGGMVVKS